jgi:hypothetical protein
MWLPLAYAAEALSARVLATNFRGRGLSGLSVQDVAALAPEEQERMSFALWALPTAALAVAATGGGYVLGRWGERAATREAAKAGAVAALMPVVLVWMSSGVSWAPFGGMVVAVPAAALGARIGGRRRSRRLT